MMAVTRPAVALLFALALALSASGAQPFDAAQDKPAGRGRVVAIGDIHADLDASCARPFERPVPLTPRRVDRRRTDRRSAGRPHRAHDEEREVLDFLFDLQRRARQAGGTVHALIGNHEVFGGRLDNQAVGPNPFPALGGSARPAARRPATAATSAARACAWCGVDAGWTVRPPARRVPSGPQAWRNRVRARRRGAAVGAIRHRAHQPRGPGLAARTESHRTRLGAGCGRWRSSDVDAAVFGQRHRTDCAALEASLKILGARRMIVAHTVRAEITARM